MDNNIDGTLVEVNGQIFKAYKNSDLYRLLKNGNYKQVVNNGNNINGYCQVRCHAKMYLYHRIIYAAFNPSFNIYDASIEIDHLDGNKLNNCLDNLEAKTHQCNLHNMTRSKGYCWNKHSKKYVAQIRLNSINIYLGYFTTRWEARRAYLNAIPIYHPTCPIHLYTNEETDCPF